jgi:hypothetical protein
MAFSSKRFMTASYPELDFRASDRSRLRFLLLQIRCGKASIVVGSGKATHYTEERLHANMVIIGSPGDSAVSERLPAH